MKVKNTMIRLPVKDLDEASRWYERCLQLERRLDVGPLFREYELCQGSWLMLFDPERVPHLDHRLLLAVPDFEDQHGRLTESGVDMKKGVQQVPGVVWSHFEDLDGNKLGIYRVGEN